MDNKFNWMEKEYLHFYSSDLNNDPLNFSDGQNQSQYQDYVQQLVSFPDNHQGKTLNLSTCCRTAEVLTKPGAEPLPQQQARSIPSHIEVSQATKRVHAFFHSKTDAKLSNFNKFVKTKTLGHLRVLEKTNLLNQQECQAIKTYQDDGCSYASQEKLFSLVPVQQKCMDFYCSSSLVKSMLKSETCFIRKIELLKSIKKVGKRENRQRIKKPKRAPEEKNSD